MGEVDSVSPGIDDNVATNVRALRERNGWSQEELAQRMTDRGFGFSQATIWKIESGQRPLKISEAVALSDALELPRWLDLTSEPEASRHYSNMTVANRRMSNAYATLRDAASAYLQAQIDLSFAIRTAQDAEVRVSQIFTSWLDMSAEQAVIEARVELAHEEDDRMRQLREVDAVMNALREHGYTPPRPEDWVDSDEEPTADRPST